MILQEIDLSNLRFSNFIKILKALELADNLEVLVPDVSKRPSTYLVTEKQKQRIRKRFQCFG